MPLLDDARALLEIDRERVRLARETAQIALEHSEVLADAEDRARRLAELGDQERPKALQFLAEAASFAPGPKAGGPPGASTRAPLSLSSSSGSSVGEGGGGRGGSISFTHRMLGSQRGGYREREDWIRAECSLVTIEIPNPRNSAAAITGDYVQVPAWDCAIPMGLPPGEAVFLDPDAMQAYLPARSGSRSSGGGSGGGGRDPRFVTPPLNHVFIGGESSSVAPPRPPGGPSEEARLLGQVKEELRSGFGSLVKELRSGSDLGLQIRRNGGL